MYRPPLHRRAALGLLSGTALAAWFGGIPVALAAATTNKRFVFVILRGALDGLAAVPPYADPNYRSVRGSLALNAPGEADGVLDLDGRFGLHPALQPLQAIYQARELAVVHAVATPYRSRSHFDGQDLLENGTSRPHGAADGWLNRTIGLLGRGEQRLGLAVGQVVPLVLRGPNPVGSWAPQQMPELNSDFLGRLVHLYGPDPVLGPAINEGIRAQHLADAVLREPADADAGRADAGRPDPARADGGRMEQQQGRGRMAAAGAPRPGGVAVAAQAVGRLLAAPQGARVAVLEIGGWDTHSGQNNRLPPVLRMLADGLVALKTGLGPAWSETVVVVATEFGRTAAPNGTNGTDHGTAGMSLVLGGKVAGGKVVGTWPGLNRLFENRDLAPTTDLTGVLKAALVDHLGLPAAAVDRVVFPDSGAARPVPELIHA
jgi:uncharacterized protein (DUF1501 family)